MRSVLIAVVLLLSVPAHGQDPAFPALTGRVVDEADILSPRAEAILTERLAAWEEASSDQLVVVTVPSLGGLAIEDYGVRLGRAWGIGVDEDTQGRGLDNGALLIIAPNDRQVRIEVGYGLEGDLTDALTSVIIQQGILPAFRSGDFDRGALEGVDGMIAALEGNMAEWQDRRRRAGAREVADGEGAFPWPLVIFFLLFLVPALFGSSGRRGRIVYDSDRRRRYGSAADDILPWIILSQMGSSGHRPGGFSSGGFGGGGFGGGFGGGGGSFGGGGASGSW